MARLRGVVAILGAVAAVLACGMPAASADVPSNDRPSSATVIPSVPFHATLDTTEATTDSLDVTLAARCGQPSVAASVWYSVVALDNKGLGVDVFSSRYSVNAIVITGKPRSSSTITCGSDIFSFATVANTRYYLLIFDSAPVDAHGGLL